MYFCAPETIQKVITRNRCNFKYVWPVINTVSIFCQFSTWYFSICQFLSWYFCIGSNVPLTYYKIILISLILCEPKTMITVFKQSHIKVMTCGKLQARPQTIHCCFWWFSFFYAWFWNTITFHKYRCYSQFLNFSLI